MTVNYEDNILYVDYVNMKHRMILYNNRSKRIRLILGQIIDEQNFDITVDTIKHLPEDINLKVKEYIRTIF
jgi:hypothetical protein